MQHGVRKRRLQGARWDSEREVKTHSQLHVQMHILPDPASDHALNPDRPVGQDS
jgi:hypothetical protein